MNNENLKLNVKYSESELLHWRNYNILLRNIRRELNTPALAKSRLQTD